jgi:steroid delta-isomerase-like uncharacterized protein
MEGAIIVTSAENKALVRLAYDELLEQGKFDNIGNLVHEEFVDHSNPPGWATDREGLRQLCEYFRSAFPDIKVVFDDVVCEGDTVMHRQTMRGTHLGEFFGIPATGKQVTYRGSHLWRILDGRLVEHQANNDDLGLMQQLGVIAAPGAEAEKTTV